ncbi:Gram-positive signal peptide protein, YSIRK family [Prevotella bivia JCVIHMP010]|nr:Gram-positive signal peptide protein, YSIRK family [Prevotella bivia JCVIHMP010]
METRSPKSCNTLRRFCSVSRLMEKAVRIWERTGRKYRERYSSMERDSLMGFSILGLLSLLVSLSLVFPVSSSVSSANFSFNVFASFGTLSSSRDVSGKGAASSVGSKELGVVAGSTTTLSSAIFFSLVSSCCFLSSIVAIF